MVNSPFWSNPEVAAVCRDKNTELYSPCTGRACDWVAPIGLALGMLQASPGPFAFSGVSVSASRPNRPNMAAERGTSAGQFYESRRACPCAIFANWHLQSQRPNSCSWHLGVSRSSTKQPASARARSRYVPFLVHRVFAGGREGNALRQRKVPGSPFLRSAKSAPEGLLIRCRMGPAAALLCPYVSGRSRCPRL